MKKLTKEEMLAPYVKEIIDDYGIEEANEITAAQFLEWEDWMTSDEADIVVKMIKDGKLTQEQFQKEYESRTGETFAYSRFGGIDLDMFGMQQTYDEWIAEYEFIMENVKYAINTVSAEYSPEYIAKDDTSIDSVSTTMIPTDALVFSTREEAEHALNDYVDFFDTLEVMEV